MKYLLDTCVISDFIKGEATTLRHIKTVSPHEIAVSSITVMEIEYGLALNPARAQRIQQIINDFLDSVTILDFNSDDAKQAARLRAILKQQGQPIGSYDILLAGCAVNQNLIFVSANVGEFTRIEELVLENWRVK